MRNRERATERHTHQEIVLDPKNHLDDCRREATLISPATPEYVAICTVGEVFGGVERHVIGTLRSLQARGICSLLILFHDGELAAQVRKLGIEPIILKHGNLSLLATARRLARMFEQRKIRIVHVHGYKATVLCALALLWYPFGVVKTEHGLPEPMTDRPMRAWRNRLYHLCDSVTTRMSGATVCYVTEDLRQYYRRIHFGLRTAVIPNGVERMDRSRFPRPAELAEACFNLLVVGRLELVKGHHFAIEALAVDRVAPDIHLYILGTGDREQELRALVDSLGLAGRVHILGFRRNVYDYIAHCDALLLPSLHEGLPYTLLEAMALGVPIIASRVGGLAEVLRDGDTALLTPPRDVASLAFAIARLRNDQPLCSRLGKAARRLQEAKYSLEAMTENYLAVYRTLALTK